jgi:hypothetical protein
MRTAPERVIRKQHSRSQKGGSGFPLPSCELSLCAKFAVYFAVKRPPVDQGPAKPSEFMGRMRQKYSPESASNGVV